MCGSRPRGKARLANDNIIIISCCCVRRCSFFLSSSIEFLLDIVELVQQITPWKSSETEKDRFFSRLDDHPLLASQKRPSPLAICEELKNSRR